MKKIVILGILLFMLVAISTSAFAYESATEYISLYSQCRGSTYDANSTKKGKYTKSFWDVELGKRGITINANGNSPYISNDGCMLLSYLHLTQYLTVKVSGDTAQVDLLEKFARLANDPSGAGDKYRDYLLKNYGQQYGITKIDVPDDRKKWSFDTWKAFFDDGGAAIIRIPGHIFTVIGYAEYNGKQYIQAVDSSSGSTIKRLSTQTAYKFDNFTSFKKTSGDGVAMQYWIPYSEFNNSCTISYAFKSSMRKSHETNAKIIYYESAKRSINEGSLADGTWSYEKPSYESKTVKYWKNGEIIDTIAIYEDTEGRLWCELADHTFIEKDMEFDGTEWERCAFVESTATYWATGIKYASSVEGTPSGKLTQGDNFGLRGTVNSTDSITDVIGTVYRMDGSVEMQSNPMNLTGTATSVDIRYSNVNNELSFGKLPNGVYRYVVEVYTRRGQKKVVIESVFGVGVEPNIELSGISFENGYTSISLNAATKEKFTLVPKYSPSNTGEIGVTWSSSDPSAVTVSANGEVQAVAPGTAIITATSSVRDSISASCSVSVYSHITAFKLDKEKVDINTDDGISSFELTAVVQPEGTDCSFEWSAADADIATVAQTDGKICTVYLTGKPGTTLIKARASDGSGLVKNCTVSVMDPAASSLKITNFAYPSTYKIDTTNGYSWSNSGSGTFSSNFDLDQLTINIYYGSSGTKLTYTKNFDPGVKSISMNSKDSAGYTLGHYIKMSKVNVTGHARIEVIISDVSGARLSRSAVIKVVSSGSTVTSRINGEYVAPLLITETEENGHRYQLYKSSYTWNQANEFAVSKGGHLATISGTSENALLMSRLQGISGTGAWLGGYHDSEGWKWVNGEPMTYTNWASGQPDLAMGIEDKMLMQTSDGKWNDAMGNILNYFIVEYESPIESIKFERPWANLTLDRDYYGHPTYIEFTLRDGVDPETFQPPKMIYQSSDTSVVTVDQDGVLTPMCAAGSAVVYAWPENYPSMVAQLEVGCYTVTNVEMGIEGYGQNVYSAVMSTGTEFAITWSYEYDGTIYGEDYVEFGYIGDGGNDEYPVVVCDNEYSNYYKAVGSGTGYAYYYAFDQNGEMITADQITVYVYGAGDEMKLPANCKTVESEAFMNTGARYLVIPAGVEEIKEDAFSNCNFDTVIFKGGNTRIEEGAFSGYPTFMFLRPGGKTENALREHGMYCLDAVYVEGLN